MSSLLPIKFDPSSPCHGLTAMISGLVIYKIVSLERPTSRHPREKYSTSPSSHRHTHTYNISYLWRIMMQISIDSGLIYVVASFTTFLTTMRHQGAHIVTTVSLRVFFSIPNLSIYLPTNVAEGPTRPPFFMNVVPINHIPVIQFVIIRSDFLANKPPIRASVLEDSWVPDPFYHARLAGSASRLVTIGALNFEDESSREDAANRIREGELTTAGAVGLGRGLPLKDDDVAVGHTRDTAASRKGIGKRNKKAYMVNPGHIVINAGRMMKSEGENKVDVPLLISSTRATGPNNLRPPTQDAKVVSPLGQTEMFLSMYNEHDGQA